MSLCAMRVSCAWCGYFNRIWNHAYFACWSVVMLCVITGFPHRWLWTTSSSERTLPILSINYKGLRIWEHWRNNSVNIAIWALIVWFARHSRRYSLHYNMVLYYPDGKRKFYMKMSHWSSHFNKCKFLE